MRERRARLLRLVRLFEMMKRAAEARLARLSSEDASLAGRERTLIAAMSMSTTFGPALQQASDRRLVSIARQRHEIRRKIEVETTRRFEADRRERAAARALERADAEAGNRMQRLDLEEMALGRAPTRSVRGKPGDANLGLESERDGDLDRYHR